MTVFCSVIPAGTPAGDVGEDPMSANPISPRPGLFDIGAGPLAPDAEILATGKVPADRYTSQAVFDMEVEQVFKRVWLNVGRVEQIPNEGDFFLRALKFANVEAIVVRGKDGAIRAFHNA